MVCYFWQSIKQLQGLMDLKSSFLLKTVRKAFQSISFLLKMTCIILSVSPRYYSTVFKIAHSHFFMEPATEFRPDPIYSLLLMVYRNCKSVILYCASAISYPTVLSDENEASCMTLSSLGLLGSTEALP